MNIEDSGNLGGLDRLVRIVFGLALLALCVAGPSTLWGLVGVIPLVTGIAGECPLYRAIGASTVRQSPREERKAT